MQTKLAGIAEVAKRRPNEKFTALAHLIIKEQLSTGAISQKTLNWRLRGIFIAHKSKTALNLNAV